MPSSRGSSGVSRDTYAERGFMSRQLNNRGFFCRARMIAIRSWKCADLC